MAKVVVIGNSGVGKSSILARCQGESFAEETRPTIGIDFVTRKVPFTDDRYFHNLIWAFSEPRNSWAGSVLCTSARNATLIIDQGCRCFTNKTEIKISRQFYTII